MDKLTVTSEELKRMAEQSYKRLGGVAQPDARVIRGLLARIQELETAGRDADELIRYCIVGNKRIYSELNNEEKETIKKLSALLNNIEKE